MFFNFSSLFVPQPAPLFYFSKDDIHDLMPVIIAIAQVVELFQKAVQHLSILVADIGSAPFHMDVKELIEISSAFCNAKLRPRFGELDSLFQVSSSMSHLLFRSRLTSNSTFCLNSGID